MSVRALQDYTFTAKYANYIPELNRRETWIEAVSRVENMMLEKYQDFDVKEDIKWAYQLVRDQYVLGSQRTMQFGGPPGLKHEMRNFNCQFSNIDRLDFFQESMYLLLCGGGVGYSVQKHHVGRMPELTSSKRTQQKTFKPEDSIEGWANCIGVLISSFFDQDRLFPEFTGKRVDFDLSNIRPEGASIRGITGKAPGPEPLAKALKKIEEKLESRFNKEFRPVDSHDMVCISSDAVLSGGVRRAALLALFSHDDDDMITCKTGSWFYDNPQRARANNSVRLLRNEFGKVEYDKFFKYTKEYGEPGLSIANSRETGANPCCLKTTKVLTVEGIRNFEDIDEGSIIWSESGWTKVTKKWSNGIKDVFKYETTSNTFYGTENHKVVSGKNKVEVKDAETLDCLEGPYLLPNESVALNPEDVMDGLMIGDGSVHKASNHLVYLTIGENDHDYLSSEVSHLIGRKIYGISEHAYLVKTSVTYDELPLLPTREVPKRFLYGSRDKVLAFLRGLYSANGSICGKRVTLKTSSSVLREQVQMMLSSVGIRSYFTTNKPKTVAFKNGDYTCEQSYYINISSDREKFRTAIGFIQKYKTDKLNHIINTTPTVNPKQSYDIINVEYLGEEEVFDITVDNEEHTFWTQGCNVSNCHEILHFPYLVVDEEKYSKALNDGLIKNGFSCQPEEVGLKSGFQPCVSYDTKIITKSGIGLIGDFAENNESIDVWNGNNWSNVKPIKTGEDRDFYRVLFSDGSYLDVTENHKFIIQRVDGDEEFVVKTTEEVSDILNNTNYRIRVPRYKIEYNSGKKELLAYDYGYILGDGTCRDFSSGTNKERRPFAPVYAVNYKYNFPFITGVYGNKLIKEGGEYKNVTFDVNIPFSKKLKYEVGLPDEIFSWDRESIINFIAGWIDSDGTITYNNKFRIYGEEAKIRDCQLLLSKIGVNSSVNLMSKAGTKTNKGIRNRDIWYVQVSNCVDCWCSKTKFTETEVPAKGKYQLIKSITKIEGLHDSYCFEEDEYNQAVFANVLTKQCNLTSINCKKNKTEEEFLKSCRAASIIGTLQAGLNSAKYLGEVTEQIIKREALLGVSMTGIMDNPDLILDPQTLRKGAKECIESNTYMAPRIGINKAARICTIKPEGTTSCILGTSSGMHPHHYVRYIRRVQANKNESIFGYFQEANPVACEKSVWSANDTDYVITFACETSSGSRNKNQMSAIELLEVVQVLQENWVDIGVNNDLCVLPKTSHTVSNTINVKPDEWEIVSDFIFNNQTFLSGISLLSNSGDKDYPQAPFTAIYLPSQIAQEYGKGSILASGLIERALVAFNSNLWVACDAAMGFGFDYDLHKEKLEEYKSQVKEVLTEKHDQMLLIEKQLYFVESCKKFASKYMDNDLKKTTYLLKDVYNWKTWSDLKREYKDVDYSLMIEESDNTNFVNEPSCSGGKCDL